MEINVSCPAKINLGLEIFEKQRSDDFHSVNMIMQSINVFDFLKITRNSGNTPQFFFNKKIDCGVFSSTVHKASDLFFEYTGIKKTEFSVFVEKNIPVAAGLAGGSSDAAGVLVGLNEIFKTNLNVAELLRIGEKIGCDVPFCIVGGTVNATGKGEKLNRITNSLDYFIVVVKPNFSISTKKAYEIVEKNKFPAKLNSKKDSTVRVDKLFNFIKKNDLFNFSKNIFNDFDEILNIDVVQKIKKNMMDFGALNACMSGSGPSVFGIFDNMKIAENCFYRLKNTYNEVFLCRNISYGAKILNFRQ